MLTTSTKLSRVQKMYRVPVQSATDLQSINWDLYGDEDDVQGSLFNDLVSDGTVTDSGGNDIVVAGGDVLNSGGHIVSGGRGSDTLAFLHTSDYPNNITDFNAPESDDIAFSAGGFSAGLGPLTIFQGPTSDYSAQPTVPSAAGSFAMTVGTCVEPAAGYDTDVFFKLAHHGSLLMPRAYPRSLSEQDLTGFAVAKPSTARRAVVTDLWREFLEAYQPSVDVPSSLRHGLFSGSRQGEALAALTTAAPALGIASWRNIAGAQHPVLSRHGLAIIQEPDLTARIAHRLAEIPEIVRAADSVLPNEDVIDAALRIAEYLPAATSLPQIEIDDSTGSISLVWRDHLHENAFSLEIPNSRYVVGVGFGRDFSNFKPWRHLISDERKIVAEIESSEPARKLLSGA